MRVPLPRHWRQLKTIALPIRRGLGFLFSRQLDSSVSLFIIVCPHTHTAFSKVDGHFSFSFPLGHLSRIPELSFLILASSHTPSSPWPSTTTRGGLPL